MSNAKSFAERAASEPTDLHRNFAAWLKEQTGVDVDLKTVQLACSMRMDFQKSEENQDHLADRKQAAAAKKAKAAADKKARLEKQLAALQAELAKETAPVQPASKPAPAAKKATPSKAADKPATPPAKATETPAKRAPRTRRQAAPKTTAVKA